MDRPSHEVTAALRRVDLNLLVHLDALLEHRHVTRAAEATGIGQSAMSTALARLRRLFDDPLLVRNGRVHELTPLARIVAEQVRAVLVATDQLLGTSPAFDPASDRRSFTVVASDYLTLVLLRPLLEALRDEAPGFRVNVVPVSGSTAADLSRSKVDLIIMPRQLATADMRGFSHRSLFTDRYVAVVWRGNTEVGDRIDSHGLETVRYVRHLSPTMGDSLIDHYLAGLGIHPEVALATHSFTLVPWLLPGTSLFAFAHERLVTAAAVRDQLRVVECEMPLPVLTETMFWHPIFHDHDPAHRWLRERIAELAQDLDLRET